MVTESALSAKNVASSFVKQYYSLLETCPEYVHKFYRESSQLGWAEPDGAVTSVTTLREIDDKIMSYDCKDWSVDLKHVDAQDSKDGGIIVAVTGVLSGKETTKKNFNQTFFLAKQERGFYVLNDIFRYADICEPITNIVPDQAAPTLYSARSTTSICHKSAQAEIEADKVNVEENSTSPVLKESVPINIFSDSSEASQEDRKENVEEKSTPPVLKESVPINISSDSSEASHEDINSTLAPVSNIKTDSPKVSYESVLLAKTNHETSPKSVSILLKADYKTAVSTPKADYKTAVSTPKASPPPGNGSSKVSNTTNAHEEGRGIYIGNLPYDVTKQAIAEEVKIFGPVRRGVDSIQIRRQKDGFCYGFVEFESADSARHAVQVHVPPIIPSSQDTYSTLLHMAHRIYFGEKESYISYKKASNQGNNKSKGRSPPGARFRNNPPKGRDTDQVTGTGRFRNGNHFGSDKGQVTDAQPSRQTAERWYAIGDTRSLATSCKHG